MENNTNLTKEEIKNKGQQLKQEKNNKGKKGCC